MLLVGLRPHLLDRNHGISEEERRKRLELRTRLRRKKMEYNGGLSLADRILIQRREVCVYILILYRMTNVKGKPVNFPFYTIAMFM